jgi:hypothetical protein
MTDIQAVPAAPAAPVEKGELMDIGTVAAHNIVNVLGLAEDKVTTVRDAIRDEIQLMGAHFSSAMSDVSTHFEVETNKVKAEYAALQATLKAEHAKAIAAFSYVKANKVKVASGLGIAGAIGAALVHFL